MNETVTIDGKEYEVLDPLTTESHNATHARIGESENAVKCEYSESERGNPGFQIDASWIYFRDMPKLGIQPLKLLPKKPVEFVGEVWGVDTGLQQQGKMIVELRAPWTDGIAPCIGMTFRCVEVTE